MLRIGVCSTLSPVSMEKQSIETIGINDFDLDWWYVLIIDYVHDTTGK
jgi:hypothetical protein